MVLLVDSNIKTVQMGPYSGILISLCNGGNPFFSVLHTLQ